MISIRRILEFALIDSVEGGEDVNEGVTISRDHMFEANSILEGNQVEFQRRQRSTISNCCIRVVTVALCLSDELPACTIPSHVTGYLLIEIFSEDSLLTYARMQLNSQAGRAVLQGCRSMEVSFSWVCSQLRWSCRVMRMLDCCCLTGFIFIFQNIEQVVTAHNSALLVVGE